MTDSVNPSYYRNRSIECIEFTRHLNFTLGSAFKYIWRLGNKDKESMEWGKINWYIHDAIILRPKCLTTDDSVHLLEDLFSIKREFSAEHYELLAAIILAAAGHYTMLVDNNNPNVMP